MFAPFLLIHASWSSLPGQPLDHGASPNLVPSAGWLMVALKADGGISLGERAVGGLSDAPR
jgi:hypothetical protein